MAASTSAISASAPYGVPPTMIGTGSPSRRLNSRAVRAGSLADRRSAASPMSTSESSRCSTTVGIWAAIVPNAQTSDSRLVEDGVLRTIAAAE